MTIQKTVSCLADVDECLSNVCGTHSCVNLPGNYRCDCQSGYTPTGGGRHGCEGMSIVSYQFCRLVKSSHYSQSPKVKFSHFEMEVC